MKITFDPAANADLDRIFAWISKDNQRAAYAMIARIEAQVGLLATPGLAYGARRPR
jgi:plasmid stabilization system protein ParE